MKQHDASSADELLELARHQASAARAGAAQWRMQGRG